VECVSVLPNSVLRLAGYKLSADEALPQDEEKRRVLGTIELTLVRFLRERFPECQVTVSPATLLRQA
jgi:hypothetical protein